MNTKIFERLKEIMAESMPEMDLSEVHEDSRLREDLGMDSLSTMMVALMIEEEYGFTFEGAIRFDTAADICRYIEEHATQKV